jgi:hypothetical protein
MSAGNFPESLCLPGISAGALDDERKPVKFVGNLHPDILLWEPPPQGTILWFEDCSVGGKAFLYKGSGNPMIASHDFIFRSRAIKPVLNRSGSRWLS